MDYRRYATSGWRIHGAMMGLRIMDLVYDDAIKQ